MTPEQLNRRLRYLGEANARIAELKSRTKGAAHFLRRHEPEHMEKELYRLRAEVEKLLLHVAAWNDYVPNDKVQTSAPDNQ
jgi:hypothetical protein